MKHFELVPPPATYLHSTIAADLMAAIPCVVTDPFEVAETLCSDEHAVSSTLAEHEIEPPTG